MVAGAISFNSGVLLFADTDLAASRKTPRETRRIFHRPYGSSPAVAHSVFVVREPVDWAPAVFQRCERAVDAVRPAERTIERMREAIERSLCESYHGGGADRELPLFVGLYSPSQLRYSLFRTVSSGSTTLREVDGHQTQGNTAYIGHHWIRDGFNAPRSLDELDLPTVFSLAVDTLGRIREAHDECGDSTEMVAVHADGHVSDVQRIAHDSRDQRSVTLSRLIRSWASPPAPRPVAGVRPAATTPFSRL